jgi:CheY-like chemotaxis protein/HPt (histidine-containing phosphotransfer) domain-containing protein
VDDNATNRDILQRQLRSWRLRTETAADGASGLHRLREAAKRSDPFRIAVLDMQMPKMDGEDLGRVIKTDPLLNRTRLVLMTSLGNRGDTDRLRDIGFDARLIKPVRQSKLFNTLTNVLSSGSHDKTHRSPSTSRRFPQIANTQAKILLAEDNITNQQVALGMLKKMGLSAHPVGNGAEAIQALQHTTYDMVLMDVQMPVLDGLEATRTIRNWKVETGTGGTGNSKLESGTEDTTPETKSLNCSIPIIAMTAHAMQGDREKCLESGMDDYLAKPVDPQALLEVLRTWLPQEIREETTGGDAAEQDIDETLRAGLEPDAPASAPTDTDVVFDRSILMDRLQGDEALAATVIAAFLEDMPGQIASLREYVEQERVDQIVSQAHTIKGAAANLGAEALRKAALKMEKAAGEEAGSLETCLSVLERQFDRLHMELMQISSGCGRSQQEKGETHD